jgi:hypothetical protein
MDVSSTNLGKYSGIANVELCSTYLHGDGLDLDHY